MYAVAGLPQAVHANALAALSVRFPLAIVKGNPSPSLDGALYPRVYVDNLVRTIGAFALRRRRNGNAQPAPAAIILLFVPSPDQEALLEAFDFALMVAPLVGLVARDHRGRQFRHDPEAVADVLAAAVAPSADAKTNLNEVRRRIAYQFFTFPQS